MRNKESLNCEISSWNYER